MYKYEWLTFNGVQHVVNLLRNLSLGMERILKLINKYTIYNQVPKTDNLYANSQFSTDFRH